MPQAAAPAWLIWIAAPGRLRRKCGSPPQVSSTSGFRRLATARGGLGDPLLHFGHRPAAADCQWSTTAAAPTRLESVAPFDRLDGVRRSLARRTREDRHHAGDDDLAGPSPDDRCDPQPAAGSGPATGKEPGRPFVCRSFSPSQTSQSKTGWSPLSTGPVLRASIRCCPSISHGTPSTSWTTVRNRGRHEQDAAGIPTQEGSGPRELL